MNTTTQVTTHPTRPRQYITITITPDRDTRPTIISGRWIAGELDITDEIEHTMGDAWDTRGPLPEGVSPAGLAALRKKLIADFRAGGTGLCLDAGVPNEPLERAMRFTVNLDGHVRSSTSSATWGHLADLCTEAQAAGF